MFQTEPIQFLQSFASDGLTTFFVWITSMGYPPFYVGFLSLLLFGISFRRGFLLLQVVLWTALITELLKNLFGLPRPSDVDSAVLLLSDNGPNPTPFTGEGGSGFFSLPDPEAVRYYREQPDWSYGLPSGHTSVTTATWGVMALLFRHRVVWALGAVIVLLMPLSRMYLGRHFLADVLAGLALGILVVLLAWRLFLRDTVRRRLLDAARVEIGGNPWRLSFWAVFLGAPLALPFISPMVSPISGGRLFGVNLAFLLIARRGFPDDAGSLPRRVVRVLLAPGLYIPAAWVAARLVAWTPLDADRAAAEWLEGVLPTLALLWGTVWIGLRTGLYRGRVGRA